MGWKKDENLQCVAYICTLLIESPFTQTSIIKFVKLGLGIMD